jgi:hypothetical protein
VELNRLIDRISDGSKSLDAISQKFKQFAKQLRAHEAAENRNLQTSFGIDI